MHASPRGYSQFLGAPKQPASQPVLPPELPPHPLIPRNMTPVRELGLNRLRNLADRTQILHNLSLALHLRPLHRRQAKRISNERVSSSAEKEFDKVEAPAVHSSMQRRSDGEDRLRQGLRVTLVLDFVDRGALLEKVVEDFDRIGVAVAAADGVMDELA